MEAAVGVVGVPNSQVTTTQLQRRRDFPVVAEAVDTVEFDATVGVDEHPEHPTPTDRGEPQGITHQRHPPRPALGESEQIGELAGAEHPCFIDVHRRTVRQIELRRRTTGGVFCEQLVDRVRRNPRLRAQDTSDGTFEALFGLDDSWMAPRRAFQATRFRFAETGSELVLSSVPEVGLEPTRPFGQRILSRVLIVREVPNNAI